MTKSSKRRLFDRWERPVVLHAELCLVNGAGTAIVLMRSCMCDGAALLSGVKGVCCLVTSLKLYEIVVNSFFSAFLLLLNLATTHVDVL